MFSFPSSNSRLRSILVPGPLSTPLAKYRIIWAKLKALFSVDEAFRHKDRKMLIVCAVRTHDNPASQTRAATSLCGKSIESTVSVDLWAWQQGTGRGYGWDPLLVQQFEHPPCSAG